MGGCETLLEQQAHRVAFIAKARLHTDKDIPKLNAQNKDIAAIGLNAARRRPPAFFNLCKPGRAAHMLISPKPRSNIRRGAMAFAIAMNDHIAERVSSFGERHLIPRRLHRLQRIKERIENAKIGSRAGCAGIGRKVEKDRRHLTLGAFRAA